MDEMRETSLLFSLSQLFEDEKERVRREQREEEERLLAEEAERADNQRRLREAEERRRIEVEKRRAAEDNRKREEAARLEALKTAELERVRAEVEKNTELERAAQQYEHERRMQELKRDAQLGRQQLFLATSLLVTAALSIGGLSLYFGKLRPDQQRLVARYEAALDTNHAQLAEARRQLKTLSRERSSLERALQARDQELAPQVVNVASTPTPRRAQPARVTLPKAPPSRVNMDPNDPMNPTLGR